MLEATPTLQSQSASSAVTAVGSHHCWYSPRVSWACPAAACPSSDSALLFHVPWRKQGLRTVFTEKTKTPGGTEAARQGLESIPICISNIPAASSSQ